jgi:polysaccharide biosynthesis protein PslJ
MTVTPVHPADLEPTLVADHIYATRRRRVRLDVAVTIGILIVLLYALPARLIVPGLTYAGRPALLLALVLFAWWVLSRINPWLVMVGPQPLRWVCLFYLLSMTLSYLAGMVRGLPTLEANAQDFTILMGLEFLGLILTAADGLANWGRLRIVLRVYVWLAAFMAALGAIQSVFALDLTQYLLIPGLELKGDLAGFAERGDVGQFRVAGTATHPIEFSTVMAMAAPFAVHFALYGPTRRSRRVYLALALLIAGVIPMAISRTGVVAIGAVGLVMFLIAWNWRIRYNVMLIGTAAVIGLAFVKPGLLGTLKAMFVWFDADPSIESRKVDYEYVGYWFAQRPWLGRGPGTLIPDLYLFLDNQWLYSLVTTGLVGVAALATLHVTCIWLAALAYRRSDRQEDRHLCAALIAVQVVAMLVAATFDSLSFTTFTFTLAFMSGLCGAVWRFTHPARTVRTSTVRTHDR